MGVTSTVSWLSVGLYGGGAMSDVVLISTGAPQLAVLSPFLFIFLCWEKKCSDDTAVGGCIKGWLELECREITSWTSARQKRVGWLPEESYRCLGVHLNGRLGWRTNTGAVYEQTLLSGEAQCAARALFTLQLTAGWTASVPEMAAGSTGPLARIWRRLSQWETGGHWTNCSPPCPITPAPLHTAEAAELVLPQTCSTSPNEERFRKSFLLFSVKLHNSSVFLCQVNTPVRTAESTYLLWFILQILLINAIWSTLSHNLSLNFVFLNLASVLSS